MIHRSTFSIVAADLACHESLAGQRDGAPAHLGRALALDAGYRQMAASDPDFDPIRADVDRI